MEVDARLPYVERVRTQSEHCPRLLVAIYRLVHPIYAGSAAEAGTATSTLSYIRMREQVGERDSRTYLSIIDGFSMYHISIWASAVRHLEAYECENHTQSQMEESINQTDVEEIGQEHGSNESEHD